MQTSRITRPWFDTIGYVIVGVALLGSGLILPATCRCGHPESSAISSLRTLVSAVAMHQEGDLDNDGLQDVPASLAEMQQVGLIDSVLGSGYKAGYHFVFRPTTEGWQACALPAYASYRSFFVDQSGVIRSSRDGPAFSTDQPL